MTQQSSGGNKLLRNENNGHRGYKPSVVEDKLAAVLNELQNPQSICDTSANTGVLSNHLSNSNLPMNSNKVAYRTQHTAKPSYQSSLGNDNSVMHPVNITISAN